MDITPSFESITNNTKSEEEAKSEEATNRDPNTATGTPSKLVIPWISAFDTFISEGNWSASECNAWHQVTNDWNSFTNNENRDRGEGPDPSTTTETVAPPVIETAVSKTTTEGKLSEPNQSSKDKDYTDNTNSNKRHFFINRDSIIMVSPSTKRFIWAFAFVVICVTIGVLASSLKKVSSTEMGLQYNIHKKQLDDAAKSGGLFVGPPGYRFVKFPSTFITVDLNNRQCVSNDGLIVTFSVTFQYQMTEANVYPAIIKYRDYHKWASMVEQAGISAIHHSCAEFMVSEFQTKRGIIQTNMFDNLKIKLEGDKEVSEDEVGVHAVAVSLQLTYVGLPNEYNTAVSEKQAAEEDIALAIAQRKQETTKANTELLRANEEARKIRDTANNEAEVLLTEARLKAEETLYTFEKEAEALIQVKNELNLTTEGVLAYLTNRLLSEADTLRVTTGEPAKLSRRDEL